MHIQIQPVYNYGTDSLISQELSTIALMLLTTVKNHHNYPHSSQSYPQDICGKMSRNTLFFPHNQLGLRKSFVWITFKCG